MTRVDFSPLAKLYSKHRPTYPAELFAYLAGLAPGRALAWDCATGSGQAALGLAEHFDAVVGTDISADQIEQAFQHPRVRYVVAPAERSPHADASVALVTVAQGVHWFDLDAFYAEVARVLEPGGVLAVWGYHLARVSDDVDNVLSNYCLDVLAKHWGPGIQHLVRGYMEMPFVDGEIETPPFVATADWNLADMEGFLRSWSATKSYADDIGGDPLGIVWEPLMRAWGDPTSPRRVEWDLFLRVARF
jgi:SAM-dependent methyltransferase